MRYISLCIILINSSVPIHTLCGWKLWSCHEILWCHRRPTTSWFDVSFWFLCYAISIPVVYLDWHWNKVIRPLPCSKYDGWTDGLKEVGSKGRTGEGWKARDASHSLSWLTYIFKDAGATLWPIFFASSLTSSHLHSHTHIRSVTPVALFCVA